MIISRKVKLICCWCSQCLKSKSPINNIGNQRKECCQPHICFFSNTWFMINLPTEVTFMFKNVIQAIRHLTSLTDYLNNKVAFRINHDNYFSILIPKIKQQRWPICFYEIIKSLQLDYVHSIFRDNKKIQTLNMLTRSGMRSE